MRSDQVTVRRLESPDVEAADRVMRTAFGTYLGLPEPGRFGGDAELVRTRSQARHTSAFVAEVEGRVVGSSFVTRWGEFGLFGPLTVDPSLWDAGVGGRMMGQVTAELDDWGAQLAGLFTFPNSPKHIGLYHRHGFYPRALTALMERHVSNAESDPGTRRMSELSAGERDELVHGVAAVSSDVFDGLDLTAEIEELADRQLGDVVFVDDDRGVDGFAICHLGAGTEAGSGTCYVKFAAARPGPHASSTFTRLVIGCEALAVDRSARTLLAGVNTARQAAYEQMLARGYRAGMFGLAMHRPNRVGFSRRSDFVIDDWR